MVGAALLVAARQRWLWTVALLVLLGGVYLAGMSVGLFYIPAFGAAVWVTARRLNETRAAPSFLDTKPRKGIIYTESELDAMKHRPR
jgi:4-amino-4-deoxy-L-arabinose transferase-like glycosyltransferase